MRQHRVSAPVLNHNIGNISSVSAFHWGSHLLTEDYKLTAKYGSPDDDSDAQGLTPGSITEIEMSIPGDSGSSAYFGIKYRF